MAEGPEDRQGGRPGELFPRDRPDDQEWNGTEFTFEPNTDPRGLTSWRMQLVGGERGAQEGATIISGRS